MVAELRSLVAGQSNFPPCSCLLRQLMLAARTAVVSRVEGICQHFRGNSRRRA